MKAPFIFFFALIGHFVSAQTYFVVPTEKGFEQEIVEALRNNGAEIVENREDAQFSFECVIRLTNRINSTYKGYLRALDSDGNEVLRSKETRAVAVALNGFNAGQEMFRKIGRKDLPSMLSKLKSISSP